MNPQPQPSTPQFNLALHGTEPIAPHGPVNVVPKIIAHQGIHLAQRRDMLDKYRQYVQQYANMCPQLNKEVLRYNSKVTAHIHQTDHADVAKWETDSLKAELGKVSTQEYNAAAKAENLKLGEPLIKLKKHIPIKKATEHVFSMILFKYAMQMEEKNNILKNCGATTTRALQKVKVNHHELANTVIDNVYTLPYCKRTIHNHINRLVEAGVLFDYTFKGREKPVEYFVNSEILTVFCKKNKKSLTADNQLFKYGFEKKLHNNEIDTRTYINKKEIIAPVNKQVRLKDAEALSGILPLIHLPKGKNRNIDGNTLQRKQLLQEQDAPGPENLPENIDNSIESPEHQPPTNEVSQFLLDKLEDRQTLMENFSKGHYQRWRFNPKPNKNNPFAMLTMAHLEYELTNGSLFNDEFLEVLQQILLKMCGPIYRKSNKNGFFNNPGASFNGYKELKTMLLNNNGTIPTKQTLLVRFKGLLWRLKFASNYYNSKPVAPLFISEYLNPTRTTKKEGGFAYTLTFYKNHQALENHNQKVEDSKKKQLQAAKLRKERCKVMAAIDVKFAALKNGRLSIIKYCDYLTSNAHITKEMQEYGFRKVHVSTKNQC